MTRSTKAQAKQAIELYGQLLKDHAVISDIEMSEARQQAIYKFTVYDPLYVYEESVDDLISLSKLLTAMWSAYSKARFDLGFD